MPCSSLLSLAWLVLALLLSLLATVPLHPLASCAGFLATLTSPSSLPVLLLYSSLVVYSSLHHATIFSTSPSILKSWASLAHQLAGVYIIF